MWKFVIGRENATTCIYYRDDRNHNEHGKHYKLSNLIYGWYALNQIIAVSIIRPNLNLWSETERDVGNGMYSHKKCRTTRQLLSIQAEFGSPSIQIANIGSGNSLILTRLNVYSKPYTLVINRGLSTPGAEQEEQLCLLCTQTAWEGSACSLLLVAAASFQCHWQDASAPQTLVLAPPKEHPHWPCTVTFLQHLDF